MSQILISKFQGRTFLVGSEEFKLALDFLRSFPVGTPPEIVDELIDSYIKTFKRKDGSSLTRAEILALLENITVESPSKAKILKDEKSLEDILPKSGFLNMYKEYTSRTESPLSFHVLSSFCVAGAALGRKVYLDMGFFKIFPNVCGVLVGPTGLVKKTSAVDIAKEFINELALCPILAEQITPSAFVSSLARKGGHHFLYIPEMSVLFDKQKFHEGLITLLLRLLDCPDNYLVTTQSRGDELVQAPVLNILAGTTPDQMLTSMSKDVLQSGFINRLVWIYEEDTHRIFPVPERGPYKEELFSEIERLKIWSGRMTLSTPARCAYEDWYIQRKERLRKLDSTVVRAVQRGDIHMLRISMITNLLMEDSLEITRESLEFSIKFIEWVEERMPRLLRHLHQNTTSAECDAIIEVLKRMGGAADHSSILRRLSGRMSATQFKQYIQTLEESGILVVSKRNLATFYFLKEGYGDTRTTTSA